MQKIIRHSLIIWGVLILLSLSTAIPLRWSLQKEVFEYQKVFDFFYVGIAYDLKELLLLHSLIFLMGVFFCIIIRTNITKAIFANFIFAISMYFYAVSSSQFFIERGHFPTGFDALNSAGDIKFYLSYFPLLLKNRILMPTLLGTLPFLIIGYFLLIQIQSEKQKWHHSTLQVLMVMILSIFTAVSSFNFYIQSIRFFPLILDRETVQTPFALLSKTKQLTAQIDVKTWIRNTPIDSKSVQAGMHYLGLTDWKQSLAELSQKQKTIDLGLNAVVPLMYQGVGNQKLVIWHIILEGFRMDDTHYKNSKAFAEVSPLVSSFYDSKNPFTSIWSQTHTALSFVNLYQAGLRTSQGISASLCGLGTLPFSLSFKRDFGKTDLSCLPRVFNELGFQTQFYYGASPTFDKLNVFFADQKTPIDTNNELNEKLKWQGWGIPDQAFFDYIAETRLQNNNPDQAEYNIILSKTNHSPYASPPDISNELSEQFKKVLLKLHAKNKVDLSDEAEQRLLTYMYTDAAAASFVQKIIQSPMGARSVFVIHGDHSTFHESLWDSQKNIMEVGAKIPLTILFPYQQKNSSVILNAEVFSQNDIPRILWKLLSSTNHIQSQPLGQINHSFGAQKMSEFAGPFGKNIVWGVSAHSYVYNVNMAGELSKLNLTVNKTPELQKPPEFRVPGDIEVLSALNFYFNFSFEEKTKK